MADYVIMPKLGLNMRKGTIVKWLKDEGDFIKEQDIIMEIETDKVIMPVESQSEGILRKIFVKEGETIPVTMPIAIIAKRDENIEDMLNKAYQMLGKKQNFQQNFNEIKNNESIEERRIQQQKKRQKITQEITPRARRKAQELDISLIDLTKISQEEVIKEKNIIDYYESKIKNNKSREDSKIKDIQKSIQYSGMRRIIGERLCKSKFTAPHICFTVSIDMTRSLQLINKFNEEEGKLKVTINDFIIWVTSRVLINHPNLNSSLVNDKIVYYSNINIGIAVDTGDGLIVPVIRSTDKKDLVAISEEVKKLVSLARKRNLLPEEYQGGTFTISNLGMYGIEQFTAIINYPEVAILAIGEIRKKPVVVEEKNKEKVGIHSIMKVTISVDHRIVDGAEAAKFLQHLKHYLEFPEKLVL